MIILLILYGILATWLACRYRIQRNNFKLANEMRAQMIEETRRGRPPFLLNPGVEIVITKTP